MPIIVLGTLALAGYVAVRRALDSTTDADLDPVIDITAIESAVEENGLLAVADTETLESAINDDELDAPIDVQRLQSTVEEEVNTIEEAIANGDIESIVMADELDAVATDGLSAITEQEIIEGAFGSDEIGVSLDVAELRAALENRTGVLERASDAIAEPIIETVTDGSIPNVERESTDEGHRIAVVNEHGALESLVDETESDTATDSGFQSIEIEDRDPDETSE